MYCTIQYIQSMYIHTLPKKVYDLTGDYIGSITKVSEWSGVRYSVLTDKQTMRYSSYI